MHGVLVKEEDTIWYKLVHGTWYTELVFRKIAQILNKGHSEGLIVFE